MNVTREKVNDLEYTIAVNIVEQDYDESVQKQLKKYRSTATVPGFRKGMAPMSLIEHMYKTAIVSEVVQNMMSDALYKYIENEKMNILGSPLSNNEKTGEVDFAKSKDYTFYFDVAESPAFNIQWDAIEEKLCQIKISAKDVTTQVEELTKRYGKFETPETVGESDFVYGRVVELDKKGEIKEGGVSLFTSFDLTTVKDADIVADFVGKKVEEKVTFNAGKAFSAADIQKHFHLEEAVAKKFKSNVEFTLSGCSHITPHEVNDDLFKKVFPGEEIKDEAAFRKRLQKELEKSNEEQCRILYVNHVRKALLEQFSASLPETFLKRWLLSRGDKDLTEATLQEEWESKYIPSIKYEIIDSELNKIKSLTPSRNQVFDYFKDMIARQLTKEEKETDAEFNTRIETTTNKFMEEEGYVRQVVDRLYMENTFALLKEKLNPEIEKVSVKEFSERASK